MKKSLLVLFFIALFICPILKGQSSNEKEEAAIKTMIEEKIKDSPCLLHTESANEEVAIGLNGIQAQTTQTKLNQMELMRQFIGSWECEIVKDATFFNLVVNPFGTAIECHYTLITNGETVRQEKWIWGYDKNNDKIVEAVISNTNADITLNAMSFKSKNTIEKVSYKNISDFTQSSWMVKFEFTTPDLITSTYTTNNTAPITWIITRSK